ncbi:peptide ABC transporter substrate-binding protein [Schnuerera sp. xch1]|uniref:peptide ABC transporter substrate-binding protein n=1 Tax=Schnuerera sp. xch1 TaxID=2874283 RepID=UPI001CC1BC3D|nr:peptide ABC transporter substrate-binding protein [Schnuerera sp. xch1]MBZ2175328.1 peptide ABC transporter substrate-binding protein [Schnuerera sp. xch1]
MKHEKLIYIILTLLIVFILAGCEKDIINDVQETLNSDNNPAKYEPEYGGNLVLPVTTLNTLNPLIANNLTYYHFNKLIFESLFELDENFNITNQLAKDYTIKDNGTISIKLKDNVFWHDGKKFTAEDVAFTINTIKYASNESTFKEMWNFFIGKFNSADINDIIDTKVVDSSAIDIVFDKSSSHKLEVLTFPIIPKHRFVKEVEDTDSYKRALVQDDYIPIGTGPYRFVKYEKYKTIDLEYYDDYREGRPYIDNITGKILEDDELALVAFETGQIDLAMAVGVDWEKYDQNNRIKIIEFISQNYEFLGFNFSNEIFNSDSGQGLRKAIAYGIDRQAIIENVYLGHATQTDLPIHPDSWLLSDRANIYGCNLDRAREELQKIGWKDYDGDGFYEDENGNDISLRIITNSYNPLRLKTADMIVEDLNELGIQVIKNYPQDIPKDIDEEMEEQHWEEFNDSIKKGDYDMVLLGWQLSPMAELSFAFYSGYIQNGSNLIKYNNETMDQVLLDAYKATDKEKILETSEKLQSVIINDLPYFSLFFRNQALLIDDKIMGAIDPTFYDLYRNIEKWYIPKEYQ